ncbi:MDR family MFS transporter [Tumebacillus permanentifrigoris]|uniref:Putative MFS family arabinose efflux permease n=1 Tax=Tumebacillus permanentifrigoris TaxID=378543 RepID=A0A316D4G4_9BACL|nr:MFS transporter [Tumebacillus permanentifrigoris]PWK07456.1 putative MFS family arabinose efflux permease [Tumebacillus permanentifrigoris]
MPKTKPTIPRLGTQVWVLLAGVLFTHLGTYMLLPYLSIIFSTEKGLTLARVGLVLGAGSVAYLSGSLLGGFIADRLGKKTTMIAGLLLRAIGLLLFIWMGTWIALFLTNLLAGVGSGLYMPGAKAGIAAYAREGSKTTAFSYRGVAANIGVTVGPMLGMVLLRQSSAWLFAGAAIVYAGLALSHAFLLKKDCIGPDCPELPKTKFRALLTDRPFLVFSFATIFVWALFTQFTLALPLRAEQIKAAHNIGLIWTITSLVVIVSQSAVTRFFTKHLHPLATMATGMVILGVALGSVAFSQTYWHLMASAVLFTIGEMFIMPTSDAIVSELATPESMSAYFGVASFVFGAGEALGNIGGGRLMQAAVDQNFLELPWLLYAIVGLLLAIAYYAMSKWGPLQTPLTTTLQNRVGTEPLRPKKKQRT